jgi:hypothetical protein
VQNKNLVKPLTQIVQAETQLTVRKAAALAPRRARSRRPPSRRSRSCSPTTRSAAAPEVVRRAVTGLASSGYASSDWPAIGRALREGLPPEPLAAAEADHPARGPAQGEAGRQAAAQATSTSRSRRTSTDGATPPAEYWEKRYKSWQVWREDVKESLFPGHGATLLDAQGGPGLAAR